MSKDKGVGEHRKLSARGRHPKGLTERQMRQKQETRYQEAKNAPHEPGEHRSNAEPDTRLMLAAAPWISGAGEMLEESRPLLGIPLQIAGEVLKSEAERALDNSQIRSGQTKLNNEQIDRDAALHEYLHEDRRQRRQPSIDLAGRSGQIVEPDAQTAAKSLAPRIGEEPPGPRQVSPPPEMNVVDPGGPREALTDSPALEDSPVLEDSPDLDDPDLDEPDL